MVQGWKKIGCMAFVIFVAGITVAFTAVYFWDRHGREEKLAARLNDHGPIRPIFLHDRRPCPEPKAADRHMDKVMLDAAFAADAVNPNGQSPVQGYVVSYFAWHWKISGGRRCPPADALVAQLAPLLDRYGWPAANTQLNDLRLARGLPPSAIRAQGLAKIAFLGWIPPSDRQGEDSRPYARQLLAEQGRLAMPWRAAALREINAGTRLGTGAAYLAVATDPEAALPRVRQAMDSFLRDSRDRRIKAYTDGGEIPTIRSHDGDRLIELGYALARAGSKADAYSQPIIDVMNERIARASPPFALMAAQPTEFCRIAQHIGGRVAASAKRRNYCAPDFKGGDGAPRQF